MKISIITVTWNALQTLSRTLDSVGRQTHREIEHIIMDGGSTDGTVAMAEAYRTEADYAVTVVSERDKGLYDAMNKAMKIATGDYMVFLNAGDKLHSADTLANVVATAEKCGMPGIVYGDTAIVDDKGNFLHLRRLRPPKQLSWKSFKQGMLVCHQSFYVRRDIAQEYDLNYRFSADFDWCIRCMKEGEKRGLKNIAILSPSDISAPSSQHSPLHSTLLPLTDYLSEGMTTANHKASLKERFNIMAKHYGWFSTAMHHVWFIFRAIIRK